MRLGSHFMTNTLVASTVATSSSSTGVVLQVVVATVLL